jgi:hypothetical protein
MRFNKKLIGGENKKEFKQITVTISIVYKLEEA